MKLKRFYESTDNRLELIKDYFNNIEEDTPIVSSITYNLQNDDYVVVYIRYNFIKNNITDINELASIPFDGFKKLMSEIKTALVRIKPADFRIEFGHMSEYTSKSEIYIRIFFDSKSDIKIDDFLVVNNNGEMKTDPFKLKSYFKSKFNLTVKGSEIMDDSYNQLSIKLELKEEVDKDKLKEISLEFSKFNVKLDGVNKDIRPVDAVVSHLGDNSVIYLILDSAYISIS